MRGRGTEKPRISAAGVIFSLIHYGTAAFCLQGDPVGWILPVSLFTAIRFPICYLTLWWNPKLVITISVS